MQIEIERKAWIDDSRGLLDALASAYGPPRRLIKEDRYFCSHPPGAMGQGPRGHQIRLRREGSGATVTAKQRRLEGTTEINREFEFHVGDTEAFTRFLTEYLNFLPLVEKRKTTDVFDAGVASIECSKVDGLGHFFEVEVLADDESRADEAEAIIDAIFARFDAFLGPAEARSYTSMLLMGVEASPFAAC